MKPSLFILFVLFAAVTSWGADTKVVQSQAISVEFYGRPEVGGEVIPIRIRDVDSDKRAQISLQKRRGNEGVWEGFFRIQFFKGDSASRVLEFTNKDKTPYFVYYVREGNIQKVKLFQTAAEMARQIDRDSELKPEEKESAKNAAPQRVALPSPEKVLEMETVAPAVTAVPQAGAGIEEQEAQKMKALIEQEAKLSALQKTQNKLRARELAEKADQLYQKQDYAGAEKNYSKALGLDPEGHEYLYRYGVSLYKVGEYQKSLLNLSIAEVPAETLLERDYYTALNHLKLKENEKALKELLEIRDEENPNISPTAAYLAGTLQYQKQDFAGARKSMEFVLDKSKSPQMDKAAEEMLEQIDKMENFIASKKEKYRFTFFAGPVYDENVLNLAANNVATDVQAVRATYGASALGIWHRTMSSDFGTQLSVSDYYSLDTKLQPNADLQAADPLEIALTLPYHKDFETGSRALSWEVIPQAKSIHMSSAGGARQELIRSYGASTSLATPVRRDLYVSGKMDFFSDTSYLSSSVGDDSQSGSKYGLTVTPTFFMDLKGEKSIATDLSYFLNNADGKNYRYSRLGLGVSYAAPFLWRSTGIYRLDYFNQNYSDASAPRTDTTMTVSGSMSKILSKNWNFLGTLQYTIANSDVELYKYNKMMVMGLFTYTLSILDK